MEALVQPGTAPFWIALLIIAGLGVVELLSVLMGMSASGLLDEGLGHHGPGDGEAGLLGGWMSWLNAGGVPLLVLAVILLAIFAAAGFAIQSVAAHLGGPLTSLIAGVGAFAIALPLTRWTSRGVAKIVPRDETSVLEQADFIGLVGVVTLGPLDQGNPGTVRVKDRHDNIHSLRAQAAQHHTIATGALALIVDGRDGLFLAIPAPAALDAASTDSNGE